MRYVLVCFGSLLWAFISDAQAGELRYTPINPSFGGNSFYSSHLLATAEAQNDNEEPRTPTDPLENFQRTITSSLLNRVAFQISEQIFGEDAQDAGQFLLGDTLIEFERSGDVVVVGITDGLTGSTTTIEVPAPVL